MNYVMRGGTGALENEPTVDSPGNRRQISQYVRIVTEGSAIPNTQYTPREFTDDSISPDVTKTQRSRQPSRRSHRKVPDVAAREHVSRLLRECQRISRELSEENDPIESALLGGELTNTLHDLWKHRTCRESDWVEMLNMLQIAVPAEEFEFLPKQKRLALSRVFNETLLPRTVGSGDIDRFLKILTDAGFNVWSGLSEND